MARAWLDGLLRARQAQEDVAKQHLASAERSARRAAARAVGESARVDSLRIADTEFSAAAFVAAAVALQAAAATHAAAVGAAEQSRAAVGQRREELTDAARARRTAEELHERERAELGARTQRVAQREMDETAARVHRDGTETA
jgi:hypothetical protein